MDVKESGMVVINFESIQEIPRQDPILSSSVYTKIQDIHLGCRYLRNHDFSGGTKNAWSLECLVYINLNTSI